MLLLLLQSQLVGGIVHLPIEELVVSTEPVSSLKATNGREPARAGEKVGQSAARIYYPLTLSLMPAHPSTDPALTTNQPSNLPLTLTLPLLLQMTKHHLIKLRPHLQTFLKRASEIAQMTIYTAGKRPATTP